MSVQIKSTKKFKYLPCGHAQWFDTKPDGEPGDCASVHGYDREVELTFAGTPDEMGWIIAFGAATKPIKAFIEYYFDHVTLLPANDPRLATLDPALMIPGGVLGTLRILPSGVSMEMSSLFIWEHVNAYVYQTTGGRCYVEKVQVFEHDRNSGILEVDRETALQQGRQYVADDSMLPLKRRWDLETPADALARFNGGKII